MIINKIKRKINKTLPAITDLLGLGQIICKADMPDFMVIGAQKSGTSTLHHLLMQHPQLKGSDEKELHYFDKPKAERPTMATYKKNFRKLWFDKSLTFESTPNYMYVVSAPGELYELKPDLKFIVLLREPVSRAYSAWNMYRKIFEHYKVSNKLPISKAGPLYQWFFKDREAFPSFEECIQPELEKIGEKIGENIKVPEILRRGLYHQQLQNYYTYFPREQILIFEYKEFATHTTSTLNNIVSFLGIEPYNHFKEEKRNVGEYVSKINPDTQKILHEFYRPHNEKLFELLGRRFDW